MKKFIITFMSIIITISIISFNIFISISKSIKPESISSNVETKLFNNFIHDDNGNETEIFKTIKELTTLDDDTLIKLIEHSTVNEILTDIVNSIYDYNLTGDISYKYTNEQIINIVEDNIDTVLKDIDYNITKKQRDDVIKYTYENTDYIIDTIYSTDIGDYTHD